MNPTLPDRFSLLEPATPADFKKYYDLRYTVLRKPWGQPAGSEADPTDATSIHAMLLDHDKAVAVSRLHFNSPLEGQIRYMGVDENYRGKGLGAVLLNYLEKRAKENGASVMILQAREQAIPFYLKQGYTVKEKSYLLFETIQHFLMEKIL